MRWLNAQNDVFALEDYIKVLKQFKDSPILLRAPTRSNDQLFSSVWILELNWFKYQMTVIIGYRIKWYRPKLIIIQGLVLNQSIWSLKNKENKWV